MIFAVLRLNTHVWTIDHEEAAWEPMLRPPSPVPDPFVPVRRAPSAPLPIAMLGVPFDSLNISQTVAQIEAMIESGRPHYVVTANVDFLVQARWDLELRRILFEADLVLCDGTPLVWASRWLGNPLPERVAGADLVPELLQLADANGHRIFFLGGKPEVTEQAVANVRQQYPGAVIAGHFSPPFRPLLDMPNPEILRRIRAAKPDLLFVSFGCPKAEKWMAMHYQSLGVPVSIGVGGTIDFLAGHLKRAPRWMQRAGMEWFFRLAQEPRRLAGRYARDLWFFGRAILQHWWHLQRPRLGADPNPPGGAVLVEPTWQRIEVPQQFDREALQRSRDLWEESEERHCLIELANVKFIDSTAIGFLLRLEKKLRRAGRELVLLEPSRAVQRAFSAMGLTGFFLTASDGFEARWRIQARIGENAAAARANGHIAWQGEITVRNAPRLWRLTRAQINELARRRKDLDLDLSAVRYIDSAGVKILLRAQQHAEHLGARLHLQQVPPPVQNAFEFASLDNLPWDRAA
jgi:exopolysaccharide biosynthesis WecB/TagA/CpsF family protein/anti-anti-sigma factor